MRNLKKFITNPKFALFGIIFGPVFGILYKDIAANFAFINEIYLTLLQLVIIPLIVITVMIGILGITNSSSDKGLLKIFTKTLLISIVTFLVAVSIALIMQPWISMMENPSILKVIYKEEPIFQSNSIFISEVIEKSDNSMSLGSFIKSAIPENVFESLSQGRILQAIIFFGIIATSISSTNKENAEKIKSSLQMAKASLDKINDVILEYLPFLSFFIIAYQLRDLSGEAISALLSLVLCIIATMVILAAIFICIIIFKSKAKFNITLKGIGQCVMLAFLSRSTIVTSSLVIKVMSDELRFNESDTQLVTPFGAGFLRFGSLTLYILATVLTAFLFYETPTAKEYIVMYILGMFAMVVSIGANSALSFWQISSIIMSPLGLPSSAIQSIMISLDFLTDPLEVINNVLAICALVALYSEDKEEGENR
jgi:Na+/H+-dicarboxylate symporter